MTTIKSYKGFDQNWKCRGMQYAVGNTYEHTGDVAACSAGFHACEYPLDVFNYYHPTSSHLAEVEQSGTLSRHDSDSKVASSKLHVKLQLSFGDLIKAAVDYTFARATPKGEKATGDRGAASATGIQGAASATGDQGAASATGYDGKVKGALGCALLLVERDVYSNILAAAGAVVGKDGIEADTWYMLKGGKFLKVQE